MTEPTTGNSWPAVVAAGERDANRTAKVLLFANSDWYLYNFRLQLALTIRALGAEVVLVSPAGPYVAKFAEHGLKWLPLPMVRRSLNPLREAALVWRLAALYRRERPTLVHHFTVKCVVYGSVAARLARVRSRVNAVAGLGYVFSSDRLSERLLRPPLKLMLRIALGGARARAIVQNRADAKFLTSQRLVADAAVRLIRGSGVDVDRFIPSTRPDAPRTIVLLATRLLWSKGLRVYLDAAAMLRNRLPDVEFWLAGSPDDGNPDSASDAEVKRWSRDGLVKVLGHVADVPALLRLVDIVALPTTYGEGVPRILLEAAAAGLPIIASDAPGCREIVEHGENGLLISADSSEQLVAAVTRLAADPALRRRMGAAGRVRALSEFDERLVISQTIDVYRETAALPARTAAPRDATASDIVI